MKREGNRMKRAVCVLVRYSDGKVLSVCRKDSNLWGLPGGKVEHDEGLKTAAYRELREETGCSAADLIFLFEKLDGEFLVTTFLAVNPLLESLPLPGEGAVWAQNEDVLCHPETAAFSEYNAELFAAIKSGAAD